MGKIQIRGVLDNQILPRLPTAHARSFQVRLQDILKVHYWIIEESIGAFEFSPVRQSLR
jgi:hypothetical protein